jgi:hypothetical protein
MDSMDNFRERFEALEQQTEQFHQHSCMVERRLRRWRGLACGLIALALLTWVLPAGNAKEDAREGEKGLAQRVAALEKLLKHFTRVGNEVVITGANLHIVNGLGSTICESIPNCPNGLGNLIVGYNEPRPTDPNDRTGSHNVVVGRFHNFSNVGGLVVGDFNTISNEFAVVSGGRGNTASGDAAVVCGGAVNTASGGAATVSGGLGNTASGPESSVSGGRNNTASGDSSSVSGGQNNTPSGEASSVSGGFGNTASGRASSVNGGEDNTASGQFSSVSGGGLRSAPGADNWAAGSLLEPR